MPLFASLFSSIAGGFASFLSLFLARDIAMKGAAYTAYIGITSAFLATTWVCINSLWDMARGYFSGSSDISTIAGAIAVGLGAIIPANAATVLSCCAAVWSATQVYKVQKTGILWFGK